MSAAGEGHHMPSDAGTGGKGKHMPSDAGAGTAEAHSIVSGGKGGSAKGKGRGGSAKGKGKGKGKGKAKVGGKGGKAGKSSVSNRSEMAGLNFPVGRIHSRMRAGLLRKQRCGGSAAIYMAALLEYLCAEVLELATNACGEMGNSRITPRHILLAVRGDEELSSVVTATISRGGVVPFVHQQLQMKNKKKKKAAM